MKDQEFEAELEKIPLPGKKMGYGTAGFRCDASLLPSIAFRMGCLCVLRSLSLSGKYIGLMITASHNPDKDNGVKIVDQDGGMLVKEWEGVAAELANAEVVGFGERLRALVGESEGKRAKVIFGRDSRSSSPSLCELAKKGALLCKKLLGIEEEEGGLVDLGEVTTPQLHWVVGYKNGGGEEREPKELLKCYDQTLSTSFKKFIELSSFLNDRTPPNDTLLIDCACGVGSIASKSLFPLCSSAAHPFKFDLKNEQGKGTLNLEVGADFLKTKQKFPRNFEDIPPGVKAVSVDGDADRLIYFYKNQDGHIKILDGDKILCLFVHFLGALLESAKIKESVQVGAIQTGYANGASSNYIENQNIQVIFTSTGVKHLHKAALTFDVGIYFEANGHGTIHFSSKFREIVSNALKKEGLGKDEETSLKILELFPILINQTVGDSLSDILFVEAALYHLGWAITDWDKLYTNTPASLSALRIPDRTIFKTHPDKETILISPENFQNDLNKLFQKGNEEGEKEGKKEGKWRGFVRPSGTEDVVRVYVEGEGDVGRMVGEVEGLVKRYCGTR